MGIISEVFNFDNIGGKIKKFAKWFCWLTILLIWIIVPIALILLVINNEVGPLFWVLLVGAIVLPVFVWISSWGMYAFGELVEDVHNRQNHLTEDYVEETNSNDLEEFVLPQKECPQCGDRHEYDYPKCPKCKYNYNMEKSDYKQFFRAKVE